MDVHQFFCSMVVDHLPDHPYKAEILLLSLEKYGAVPRDRIIVQCTNRVSEDVQNRLVESGYTVTLISPYLDCKYCNKLRQLDYFTEGGFADSDGVFLLDIDLAVLSPLDVPDREFIWGKIVDAPNPPLPVLQRIFAKANIEIPDVVPCDWNTGETVATNLNGGFLFVPLALVPALRSKWYKLSEFLFIRPELFDNPTQRNHIDQVSFALALASEALPYRHLPANRNFPCHSKVTPRTFQPEQDVHVLHYHQCLDEFGLVAPIFSEPGIIERIGERINDAIAAHDELMFFDMYKQNLAKQAVKAIPFIKETPFSNYFLARTWAGGKKRRLILHAGTPKTGTSSLQLYLGSNRELLAENGLWYPPPSEARMPKHQKLVGLLRRGDLNLFVEYIESALRDMPDDTHTIIFTTEGIFNHWWDYPSKAKGMLRHLASLFDFELCVWFRPPAAFAAALYVQNIKNPSTQDTPTNVYGRDISFADAMKDGWFRRHLDYLGFCYEAQHLFGEERVKPFLYEGDTVTTFKTYLGIDHLPQEHRQQNISLRAPGIEIMRIANRYGLSQREQQRLEGLAYEIDGIIGERADEFSLSEQEKKLVNKHTRHWWNILEKNLRALSCPLEKGPS